MMLKWPLSAEAQARAIWAVTAALLFGLGVGRIWWPAMSEIALRQTHARDLYEQANALDAQTRRATELRAAQSRVEEDVRKIGGNRSEADVTASFLRSIHDEAKQTGVEVRELVSESAAAPNSALRSASSSTGAPYALSAYGLTIGLRGSYRHLITLLSELPRQSVLIEIRDVHFGSNASLAAPPVLDITLHASIYRPISGRELEGAGVRAVR